MKNNYKIPFIDSAEIAVREGAFVTVIDEDTNVKFKSQIYKGQHHGQFVYFVIYNRDIYPVSKLSATYAQIYTNFAQPVGHIEPDGRVLSWDLDRGDLSIEGLVSNGRYAA